MKQIIITFSLLLLIIASKAQEREIDFRLIQAAYNDSLDVVGQLLADSADVNARTDEGVTPLMYAAQNGDSAMVELLLRYGANVNDKPVDGFSALISSCLFNHLETSIILIENNADINAQNSDGATPLMIAAAYGYYIITDMLLFYGAKTEIQDNSGNTALNIAATHGFEDIVSLLISKGAYIEAKDNEGYTPLISSAIRNNKEVANVLLKNNADVNAQNNKGYTSLMIAIKERNDSIIKMLVSQSVNKDLENIYHQNSAQLALLNKNRCLYQCLQNKRNFKFFMPYFKSISLSSGFSVCIKDIMSVSSLGISDSKFGLHFFAGYATRLGKKKVLVLMQDNEYNQYNEKRSSIFAGLSKDFVLKYNSNKESGINAGFYGAYTYESIEGTQYNVTNRYVFVPTIGFYRTIGFFTTRINYEYFYLNTYKLSPHKLSLSLSIDINFRKNLKHSKSIDWVN